MGLEVIAVVLRFLRAAANAFARRHHEQRRVVALAVLCRQDVIAQAQKIALALPRESKCVYRLSFSCRKELQGIARRFGLEKLPDGADLMNSAASFFTCSMLSKSSTA